jgi:hypothetical protein
MVNTLHDTKNLGYILYPRRRPTEPGYPRLDVILRTTPSEHHFDPVQVLLTAVDRIQGVSFLTLQHPLPRRETYPVCAGPIDLIDRLGKHLDIFSFGGSLQIEPEEEHTTLVFTSPAPILLTAESPLDRLLVEEAEILLAQRQAAREVTPGLYDQHLQEAPPLELYHAMLAAIQERYQHLPPSENELTLKFRHILRVELEATEEELSELHRRPLEGLL